jgi:Flp pilus assembly CpaF family ATPase
LGDDRGRLSVEEQRELGRGIILELLRSAAEEAVSRGEPAWSLALERRLAEAVFDSLFRLGRLQPLVDDDSVENIIITGADRVVLERIDGSMVPGPPVAGSDQELIDFLVFLASRSEVNARPFSEAQPSLHLRLDGGARLAATAWVTPRPSVVIRRHRLMQVTLRELVARAAMSPVMASFLSAMVKARGSIVVSGAQGAGKTTAVRALCAEIDPWEAIGTFETEYELHLDQFPEQHHIVHAWEARPGSGERGEDGRAAGEYATAAQIIDSFRFNLTRQIVGEIRGAEVWSMIKVMESGSGSISTTHAKTGEDTMRKLVTCAMEAGAHVTQELATTKLADTIDLIVQLHVETIPGESGSRKSRWVSEILAVTPGEAEKGYALTQVFRPVPGQHAVAHLLPDHLHHLTEHGFDVEGFLREAHQYGVRS